MSVILRGSTAQERPESEETVTALSPWGRQAGALQGDSMFPAPGCGKQCVPGMARLVTGSRVQGQRGWVGHVSCARREGQALTSSGEAWQMRLELEKDPVTQAQGWSIAWDDQVKMKGQRYS